MENTEIEAKESDGEFVSHMNFYAEIFDSHLAAEGVAIPDRVLRTAQMIVHYAIIEVSNDTKEDYLGKAWFTPIYKAVEKWYDNQYGAAIKKSSKDTFSACVMFRGHIFEMSVRRTLNKVEVEGESAWITFPIDVHDSENVLDWVVDPPNIDILGDEEKEKFLGDVEVIGCGVRRVSNNLMTINRPDDVASIQADTIPIFLAQSASLLIEGHSRKSLGLACWAAHQAVEHTLKLLIRQKTNDNPKTHVLKELKKEVVRLGINITDDGFVRKLPGKTITAIRAGEMPGIGLTEAYDIYRHGLYYTEKLTASLDRRITMNNASLLLKRPEFLR